MNRPTVLHEFCWPEEADVPDRYRIVYPGVFQGYNHLRGLWENGGPEAVLVEEVIRLVRENKRIRDELEDSFAHSDETP